MRIDDNELTLMDGFARSIASAMMAQPGQHLSSDTIRRIASAAYKGAFDLIEERREILGAKVTLLDGDKVTPTIRDLENVLVYLNRHGGVPVTQADVDVPKTPIAKSDEVKASSTRKPARSRKAASAKKKKSTAA